MTTYQSVLSIPGVLQGVPHAIAQDSPALFLSRRSSAIDCLGRATDSSPVGKPVQTRFERCEARCVSQGLVEEGAEMNALSLFSLTAEKIQHKIERHRACTRFYEAMLAGSAK
jgi:hypothetical protein